MCACLYFVIIVFYSHLVYEALLNLLYEFSRGARHRWYMLACTELRDRARNLPVFPSEDLWWL